MSSTHPIDGFIAARFILLVALSATLMMGCARSPNGKPDSRSPEADVRSSGNVVKTSAADLLTSPGSTSSAVITLSISPGYHVNANPATFPYLIATEVTAGAADGLSAGTPAYPPGEKKKFEFAAEPLAVYEGEAQIKLPLSAAGSAAKGLRSVPLSVRVQACDQEKCFPPDTLHTTIAVEIK